MKKYLSIAYCCIITSCLNLNLGYAQPSIKEGTEMPTKKSVENIIGADETGIYALRFNSAGTGYHTIIEKYDTTNYNLLFKKEMESEKTIQELHGLGSMANVKPFYVKGKIYVFFEVGIKKTNEQKLFLQILNEDQTLSKIFEIDSKKIEYNQYAAYFGRFNIEFSPDKESFMVFPDIEKVNMFTVENVARKKNPADDKSYPLQNSAILYKSGTFEKIWQKDIPLREPGKTIYLSNYTIDNANNLYYKIEYKETENSNSLSGIALGVIEKNSPTPKTITVTIPNKKVLYNFTFHFLKNTDLLICGVIGDTALVEKRTEYSNEAIFIKRVETNSLTSKFETITKIPSEVLEKKSAGGGEGFTNPEIDEMENSIYISTEQIFYGFQSEYKDIIVAKYTDNGEFQWMKPIKRFSIRGYGGYIGIRNVINYNKIQTKNKIHFVFLENPANKNYNSYKDYLPVRGAKDKANAVCISIDSNGKTLKSFIYENDYKGLNFIPYPTTTSLSGKMVLYFENRKDNTEKFATIKFD